MTSRFANVSGLKFLKRANARRAAAISLSIILAGAGAFNTSSTLAATKTQNPSAQVAKQGAKQTGQLVATGTVAVNDKRAITGTSIFTDSRIAVDCAKGTRAIVDLGKMGRVELIEGTKMTLRFTDGMISGDLKEGKAMIKSPAGVKVAFTTQEGVTQCDGVTACVTEVITAQPVQCVPVVMSQAVPSGGLSPWWLLAGAAGGGGALARALITNEQTTSTVPQM